MNTEPNRTYTNDPADRPSAMAGPGAHDTRVYDRPANRGWITGTAIGGGIVLIVAIAILLALAF